ncbi:MAG: MltA domain-containing protein [Bdellovibrionaceae bacterium]|nr:MltA domain-containing protein [Pseudobdellovibrionaceae bacterium]
MLRFLILISLLFFASCDFFKPARPALESRSQALRLVEAPELDDDLDLKELAVALRAQSKRMGEFNPYPYPLVFGNRQLSVREYQMGLEHLAEILEAETPREEIWQQIRDTFDFYEVYGQPNWGQAFMTSYFEPVIPGSKKRTEEFPTALYKKPPELIEVALELFDDRFKDIRRMRGRILDEKSQAGNTQLGPFYSREEIDNGALSGRGLELAWVDPIDAFFLQIQGSGTVVFDSGDELRIGYAEQNGQVYQAIGKFVADVIPLAQLTALNLEAYLRSLEDEDLYDILHENPSYVFFNKLKNKPLTSLGTEVTAGRTIATDGKFFPKGAVGFLKFNRPKFLGPILSAPAGWEPTSRLVLDQDSGGAIRGGGRLDLFWGRGEEAKQNASVIKQTVHLYYMAPKESFLDPSPAPEALPGKPARKGLLRTKQLG